MPVKPSTTGDPFTKLCTADTNVEVDARVPLEPPAHKGLLVVVESAYPAFIPA